MKLRDILEGIVDRVETDRLYELMIEAAAVSIEGGTVERCGWGSRPFVDALEKAVIESP